MTKLAPMLFSISFNTRQTPLIVSFPKSGRTWLRVMLDDLGIAAEYSHDGTDHKDLKPGSGLDRDKSRYRRRQSLLLVRDPRDTVVSGYFQVRKRHNLPAGSFAEFIRTDNHGIAKIVRFNLNWFSAMRRLQTSRCLQYEDLHRDPTVVLRSLSLLFGYDVDDGVLIAVAKNRTFERMRTSEATGDLADRYGKILQPRDLNDPESFKVRKGRVGGYRDYLSDDDIAYCDDVMANEDYWEILDRTFGAYGLHYRPPTLAGPAASTVATMTGATG